MLRFFSSKFSMHLNNNRYLLFIYYNNYNNNKIKILNIFINLELFSLIRAGHMIYIQK